MKFTGWMFATALVSVGLATPASAQSPTQARTSKKAVPPSHLQKPQKKAKQASAKPPVASPKR